MSKRTDREFLSDIREALERITTYIAGMSYEAFVDDVKTQESDDSLAEYGCGS
jgi:uncharacterized protein with HEPN domain